MFSRETILLAIEKTLEVACGHFGRPLAKPIVLSYLSETPPERIFAPCGWREAADRFFLGVPSRIEIEKSWWNAKPHEEAHARLLSALSGSEVLAIVLAHEIAHFFRPELVAVTWEAEVFAMRSGYEIAVRLEPRSALAFPLLGEARTAADALRHPETLKYPELCADPELLRAFLWQAWFSSGS